MTRPTMTRPATKRPASIRYIREKTSQTVAVYWELVRIIVPVTVITHILTITGIIAKIAPAFAPLMAFYGLPPELALALLAGLLVGVWNAAVLLFVLVPVADLTVADVTVFSSLVLFAHAIPIEQPILRKAGARLRFSVPLRLAGGLIFGALLHAVLSKTGWLSQPVSPAWQPMLQEEGWQSFFKGLVQTLIMIFAILLALVLLLDLLRRIGVINLLHRLLAPILSLAGIKGEALSLTTVGLLLGVSYGGGLLISEARSGKISKRQVLLSCVFMGFAHSIIEDTLIVLALGADLWSVLVARVIFAVLATGLVALLLSRRREEWIERMTT